MACLVLAIQTPSLPCDRGSERVSCDYVHVTLSRLVVTNLAGVDRPVSDGGNDVAVTTDPYAIGLGLLCVCRACVNVGDSLHLAGSKLQASCVSIKYSSSTPSELYQPASVVLCSQLSGRCSGRAQKHKEKGWSYREAGGCGPRAVSSGRDDGALVNVTALDEARDGGHTRSVSSAHVANARRAGQELGVSSYLSSTYAAHEMRSVSAAGQEQPAASHQHQGGDGLTNLATT